MPTRRETLGGLGGLLAAVSGCSNPSGGSDTTTLALDSSDASDLSITSSAFAEGESIPARYTADGTDVSPPLSIAGHPAGTETLALIVDDPDAPGGRFVHWLLWNVPAGTTTLPENLPQSKTLDQLGGARQGTNGFGEIGYRGPKPPEGDGSHTYRFRLRALDTTLDLAAGAKRAELASAIAGHVLAGTQLTAEYER